jgi:SAM-dependent methyltransferase
MDARDWDERYSGRELLWSVTPNQFVASELEHLVPGRALDLASGEGRNAIWLASRGWQVTAVDFSAAGLAKARALQDAHEDAGSMKLEWVHADVLEHEAEPGSYDLALLAYLQLPADQRRKSVRRAFEALATDGTLFVIAHDSTNLAEGTGGPPDPSVLFTAADILDDLMGYEFVVDRAERVARAVVPANDHEHAGEPEATAYDALVRLHRT